jgi:hypothetical protein
MQLLKVSGSKLYCKPEQIATDVVLFSLDVEEIGSIGFRSFVPGKDVQTIYQWVNEPYSQKFWDLAGSVEFLHNRYEEIQHCPYTHSFIGTLNRRPVCQVDVYMVHRDEVQHHLEPMPEDIGLHFLMCPPEQRHRGLSLLMFKAFIQCCYSFPQADRILGEPDEKNEAANRLVRATGFVFMKKINLSYKTANLYYITRELFKP